MGELRDLLREKVEERLDEIVEAAEAAGYVHGYSSRIAPSEIDRIIERVRAGEKSKHIAAEMGCSDRTVSRRIAARLHERGEYDPDGYRERKSERRRQGWENVRELWDFRDQHAAALAEAARQEAALLQQRLEDAEQEQRRLKLELSRERQREKRERILRGQGLTP